MIIGERNTGLSRESTKLNSAATHIYRGNLKSRSVVLFWGGFFWGALKNPEFRNLPTVFTKLFIPPVASVLCCQTRNDLIFFWLSKSSFLKEPSN
jgi:hypothetical protein